MIFNETDTKFKITQIVPFSECSDFHVLRSSIRTILRLKANFVTKANWQDFCVCVSCGEKPYGWLQCEQHTPKKIVPFRGFFIKQNDEYVMLTFDHIWPKSLGGRSSGSNGQIMCSYCNGKKQNTVTPDMVETVVDHVHAFISPYGHYRGIYKQYIHNNYPHIKLDKKGKRIHEPLIYDY